MHLEGSLIYITQIQDIPQTILDLPNQTVTLIRLAC